MATLKISDLSVGDWVRCRGRNGRIERIEVIRYDERIRVAVESDLGTMYQFVDIEDIEPIPITAEILEKNGWGSKTFKQDQLLRIVEPNGNRPFIGYRWDSRRVVIERDNDYMLRVKAEYVHQLQHALRLAGVDREINL